MADKRRDYGHELEVEGLVSEHPAECAECGGMSSSFTYEMDQLVKARQMAKERAAAMVSDEAAKAFTKSPYPSPLEELKARRGAYYGDIAINHASIGAIWGGILVQAASSGRWKVGETIPPDLVCLMMVGVKVSREAFRHKVDNIDDAQNYLDFVDDLSEEKK